MKNMKINEVAINLNLLKRFRFYHMFDPNSAKFFNRNVYQIVCIVSLAVCVCVFLFGNVELFINIDDTINDIEFLTLLFSYFIQFICCLKINVLLYNANIIWDLIDVVRMDFLTSKLCRKNVNILYNCRDWIIKITDLYSLSGITICIEWMLAPLLINAFDDDTTSHRKQNIFNFRFPVSIYTYNHYYILFYVMEMIPSLFIAYATIITDTFIMSLCWVIINQYRILTESFANVGFEHKSQSEHHEDFKSCLFDQIQLSSRLQSLYFIIRPIIVIFMGLSSSAIIFITYSLFLICASLKTYSILDVIKLGSTVSFLCIEIFLYCYIFDSVNTIRESVNFGIYSSNWVVMDLKFKKLLLLTMRMNNTNQIILKVTPKKIINLQLFANLMTTCYNIVSIMLKTINNK